MHIVTDRATYQRLYQQKNRKKLSQYSIDYYHRTNRKEYSKEWYQKNLSKNREMRRLNNNKRRMEIIEFLGGKCCQCDFSDWRALQIDHVLGGGNKERKTIAHSQSSLNAVVKKNPEKYQLLCANCNWIKRYENKELYIKETL